VLKTKDRQEYARAIHDLFRTSERLASCREKHPDRYEVELQAWQVQSRIQLLATRVRLAPEDPQLLQQLRQAVREHVDVRIRLLEQERQKAADRLERLDEQIRTLAAEREQVADKQFRSLLRIPSKRPLARKEPGGPAKHVSKRPVKEENKESDSRKPN
jgi:hypothetical protein